ncbi:ABC transporter G family member 39-like [Senna tora]|uniref:ABC transporter G family member 39-like n=1 Tax=Senna tora TaxID=362788 RepID=A0A834WXY4_9FABA|nr:ABC transporter G family member 39-like [Senna tora]
MENEKKIQGICFANKGQAMSHVMYADDIILFFKATPEACNHVNQVLQLYSRLAGQKIDKDKSILIFNPNTPRQFKRFMASGLQVSVVNQLGMYLGTKIDSFQNKTDVYKEIVDKFNGKLARWKSDFYLEQQGKNSDIVQQDILKVHPYL